MEMVWEVGDLNEKAFLSAIDKALGEASKMVRGDLRAATHTWKHEIKFQWQGPRWRGYDREIIVGPAPGNENTKIFLWVELGTKTHSAKGSKPMRFRGGYTTKTNPYSIYSGPGKPPDKWVRKWEVKGIKARRFTHISAANIQPWFNTKIFLVTNQFAQSGRAGRVSPF